MNEDYTDRLASPMLQAGQAQKEMWHNEALTLLDMLVQPSVEQAGVDDPPADPTPGQCWIVGSAPTGAWSGNADAIACWTANGWRFAVPRKGMACLSLIDHLPFRFDGAARVKGELRAVRLVVDDEQVVGDQQPAIADPQGGATVDDAARVAIGEILAALRAHGLIAQ